MGQGLGEARRVGIVFGFGGLQLALGLAQPVLVIAEIGLGEINALSRRRAQRRAQ